MSFGLRVVALLSLLVSSMCLVAQSPPTGDSRLATPFRDPAALALIQQSLRALGLPASTPVTTVAQGELTDRNGKSSPLTVKTSGVDRIRFDIGTDFSFVSNSGRGFVVHQGKRRTLNNWSTKYRRPDHLPSLSLMANYQSSHFDAQYVALEKVNGKPAHHLQLSMRPMDGTPPYLEALISEFHVWIDQTSFLVVKTRGFDFSPQTPQNRSPVDTLYGDYRLQNGALIPFHLTRYAAGHKESEIVLTSIDLGATVPDSEFQ